jgi:hypothetical protein
MLNTPTSASEPASQVCSPQEFLREAAKVLTALGMQVQPYERGGELREIEVDDPRDPSHGHAVLDREGFMTWERWCPIGTAHDAHAAAQMIATLLGRPSPAPAESPGPSATGTGHTR